MRTKIFFSFLVIISLALLSNILFERLIMRDFDEYVQSTQEDHIYQFLASVEGSYKKGTWDKELLSEALHWGMMLGYDSYVVDSAERRILSSKEVFSTLPENMVRRMKSLFELPEGQGEYQWYPLFVSGEYVGKVYLRPLKRLGNVPLKESIFRNRGREFLLISFLIAGGGSLFLAIVFTIFLSMPLRRLTEAATRVSKGDFSTKVNLRHRFKRLYRVLSCEDEIDRLTDSFNYMVEALKREDDLRRHLTSNIAHELRTPLTIIRGNIEALEDGVIDNPQEALKVIKAEVMRIVSLVEGIEDITRAEASFFEKGEPEEIELKEFISSTVEGMKSLFADKGLYLETKGGPLKVKTYPEKLQIVLKNLISNAYKFTDKGGVTISWGRLKRGGYFISVSDTGRGIPEEETKRIFNRFYKDKTSTGRGLGLSIVKELVDVMGGRIILRSQPAEGSTFTIEFPA